MDYFNELISKIKKTIRRQPSGMTAVAKLRSGTVLIADGGGVLILTDQAARTLAERLTQLEEPHERQYLERQSQTGE